MGFAELGLVPGLVEALAERGIVEPTAVQRGVIPAVLGGAAVFAVARTGSGKTLAYALPVLQRLAEVEAAEGLVGERARPRGLVLTSTLELVEQTVRAIKSVAHRVRARVRGVSGGMREREQGGKLAEPVDILVGNPTRVAALVRAGWLNLADLRVMVVDEADTLLAPGQRPDLEFLLDQPGAFQRCYLSATLPEPMRQVILARPERPAIVLAKDAHAAPPQIRVQNMQVGFGERIDAAHDLLGELPAGERGIIFVNRRERAAEVSAALIERGHGAVAIHGAMLPDERKAAIKRFRAGDGRFLVTTELGGRGLDISDLRWVLNLELPERASEYLHRIGRVGREGSTGAGRVINFHGPQDSALLAEIKRLAAGARLDTGEALRGPRLREKAQPRAPKEVVKEARRAASRPKQTKEEAALEAARAARSGARKQRGRRG